MFIKNGSFFQYIGFERKIRAKDEPLGLDVFERSGKLCYYYAVRMTDRAVQISSKQIVDAHILRMVHRLMDKQAEHGDYQKPYRATLKNEANGMELKVHAERANLVRLRAAKAPPPPFYCREDHCFLVYVAAVGEDDVDFNDFFGDS